MTCFKYLLETQLDNISEIWSFACLLPSDNSSRFVTYDFTSQKPYSFSSIYFIYPCAYWLRSSECSCCFAWCRRQVCLPDSSLICLEILFFFLSPVKQPIFASTGINQHHFFGTVLCLCTGFSPKRWDSLCYESFTVDSLYFLKPSKADLIFSQPLFCRIRPDPEVAQFNIALVLPALC